MIHVHRAAVRSGAGEKATKTGIARRFALEAAVIPLLAAMRAEAPAASHVLAMPSERALARAFRRWLLRAGVTRSELHHGSRTRKAIGFHDLRATGITWMAVRGDDALKIQQRAGHTDFDTTQIYIREAEAVRAGFGEVFPELPGALLGPGSVPENVRSASKYSELQRGGRDSNPRPPSCQAGVITNLTTNSPNGAKR